MSEFQNELFRLIQDVRENINPFSSSAEDSGGDVQLVTVFSNKWDYRDKYLQSQTQMEELKAKTEKDKGEVVIRTSLSLLKEIIPSLDDAYLIRSHATDPKISQGIDMFIAHLERMFTGRGGSLICPKTGDVFNPDIHTAVSAETVKPAPGQPFVEGSYVFKLLRRGYNVFGKVIRPAEVHVLVSKKD